MGKIAFVFSGQGAQFSGMGLDYYQHNAAARAVFDAAERVCPDTIRLCFEGEEEEIKETRNTQVCMFTFEMAIVKALAAAGIRPDMVAGFSLGEFSALTTAGANDFEQMLSLVEKRGTLMQEAAVECSAAMVAVLKLPKEKIVAICDQFPDTYAVNFNCPGQISVTAASEAIPAFSAAVKEAGGRVLPLKVAGGFHSPFMAEAGSAFAKVLEDFPMQELQLPVVANVTGRFYEAAIKPVLTQQMVSPVMWEQSIQTLIENGAETFIEIGPGNVLGGMIKRINGGVKIYGTGDYQAFEEVLREVH